jgi:cell division protein ZapA
MADKLKIKLSIADRVYPLTVDPSQEEGLRKASKHIDAMIKQFEQSYAVRDKQDVLAMCALQFASQVEQLKLVKNDSEESAKARLEKMDAFLADYLSKT